MSGLVSIIMPMHNSERFVAASIESVIAQTYSDWELIIVDDCSTDKSVEIVHDYVVKDQRIQLLKNAKNSGAAESRNYALREAKGKWIAFLDSDDLWLPEKLEKQLTFMTTNGYSFTYGKYNDIDEGGNVLGIEHTGPKRITRTLMYLCNHIGCLTVMYEREQIGLIQIADIKKRNDYAIWLKVIHKKECYYYDELLALYRIRKMSVSHVSLLKKFKAHFNLFNKGEEMSVVESAVLVVLNSGFSVIKKVLYTHRF